MSRHYRTLGERFPLPERNGRKVNIFFMLHPKNTVEYLYSDDTVRHGLERIRECGYAALPVIDRDGKYVGAVSEGDFLRAFTDTHLYSDDAQEDYVISDIMRINWNPPVNVTAPVDELVLQVMDQNFLPVTDDRGCFVGIITRRDVISYYYNVHMNASTAKNAG